MTRSLLLCIALLCATFTVHAQLVNTTWSVYESPGGLYLFDTHFGTDNVLYAGVGVQIPIANYTVTGNIFTLTDIDPDDCPDVGTYTYVIVGNVLTFTEVNDPCEDRIFLFEDLHWVSSGSTSVNDLQVSNTLSIHPNPSTGDVYVEQNSGQQMLVLIFDVAGVLVHEARLNDVRNHLDLQGLPKAMYVLHATTSQGTFSRKLVLE